MKWHFYIVLFLLFTGGVFSVNAQDLIVLKDGNIIEAQVLEISSTDIRYKRFNHLDGPTIVVSVNNVLSIRYENGTVEIFNTPPVSGQTIPQADISQEGNIVPQLNQPTALQSILNDLPAILIAGNYLKFEFSGESWVAKVNGESFSTGTIEFETTAEGGILTLRQTHIWPGAVGRTAGRVANRIPGSGAIGGALNTAGNIAGTLGSIETSGTIVLEYRVGPPASLSLISTSGGSVVESTGSNINRFSLDGKSVFAISATGMGGIFSSYGAGATLTFFERYNLGALLSPSYFIGFKWNNINADHQWDDINVNLYIFSIGILFKHRINNDRYLYNFGFSIDYFTGSVEGKDGDTNFSGDISRFGMGIQTGFSIRLHPNISLDINAIGKFGFGFADGITGYRSYNNYSTSFSTSYLPHACSIELGLSFMLPY